MAITYPLSFPAYLRPARVSWGQVHVVSESRSAYTGTRQVYDWMAGLWKGTLEFPRLTGADADDLTGFLTSLRGRYGTVLVRGNYARTAPRGTAPGSPVVDGASQTGLELDSRGWTASQTGILLRGDFIQLGAGATSRLHQVMADADSDGSGAATLNIWPPLRTSPSDGAALTTDSPAGVFALAGNEQGWNQEPADLIGITLDVVEAF